MGKGSSNEGSTALKSFCATTGHGAEGNWTQDSGPGGLGKSRHFQIFKSRGMGEKQQKGPQQGSQQNSDQTKRA